MSHALSTAPTRPAPALAATDREVEHARAIIAAARQYGLFIVPWHGPRKEPYYLIMDGPDAGHDRMMDCPEYRTRRSLPRGLMHRLLCDDLGLDSDDPYLCDRVNEMYREREQVAA